MKKLLIASTITLSLIGCGGGGGGTETTVQSDTNVAPSTPSNENPNTPETPINGSGPLVDQVDYEKTRIRFEQIMRH